MKPNTSTTPPLPRGAPTKDWLEQSPFGAVTGYVVLVTPEIAAVWLGPNTGNRRLRKAHVNTLALEMRNRQWRLTHQGIAFGVSGRLLDGQHRLQAIVDSGVSAHLLVFVDAQEDTFTNFDRGAKRDVSDILQVHYAVAAIGQTIVRSCVRGGSAHARNAMPSEVAKVLEAYKDDIAAMYEASGYVRKGRTIAPVRAAWLVHYHAASEDQKSLLKQQWKALVEYDVKRMDETTAAGERRLESLGNLRGGSMDQEAMCVGWLMFDPERRDLSRILIRETSTALDAFRAAVRSVIPELVPDAGLGAVAKPEKPKPEKRVDTPDRWRPMSDPVLGPQLRAKAIAAMAAKRAENAT